MFLRLAPALCLAATAVAGQSLTEEERSLDDLQWLARPIVVFATSPNDPRVQSQLQSFEAGAEDLLERDVVVLVDTDPDARGELRQAFRPSGEFAVVVVGKDGEVKYRKPRPITVREVMRLIDRMPMRQQEMQAQREAADG